MAIRREYRKRFYGPAWRAYRLALIERHGSRCSTCGRHVAKYLNLTHTSHDPRTSDVALKCPGCHTRFDATHAYAVRRRNQAKRVGQGWLWPEVAAAPFPSWLVRQRGVEDEKQGGLF
jgi:hypothetical protein